LTLTQALILILSLPEAFAQGTDPLGALPKTMPKADLARFTAVQRGWTAKYPVMAIHGADTHAICPFKIDVDLHPSADLAPGTCIDAKALASEGFCVALITRKGSSAVSVSLHSSSVTRHHLSIRRLARACALEPSFRVLL